MQYVLISKELYDKLIDGTQEVGSSKNIKASGKTKNLISALWDDDGNQTIKFAIDDNLPSKLLNAPVDKALKWNGFKLLKQIKVVSISSGDTYVELTPPADVLTAGNPDIFCIVSNSNMSANKGVPIGIGFYGSSQRVMRAYFKDAVVGNIQLSILWMYPA